ncbi:MAG TPA: hypothetical protein VHG32_24420 [Thermoanaerobaculia bacterium]|jgi:hypothetical protein|nr:hypothetical protein [Thermoanaerobaculia bacterium]
MSRAICKQAVAVLALMAILSMIAAAPAQAGPRAAGAKAPVSSGWTWISTLWERLAALVHGVGAATPLDSPWINPDGGNHP